MTSTSHRRKYTFVLRVKCQRMKILNTNTQGVSYVITFNEECKQLILIPRIYVGLLSHLKGQRYGHLKNNVQY